MQRHYVILLLVALSCWCGRVHAGEPTEPELPQWAEARPEHRPTLALSELQSLACRHNPTLLQARSQIAGTYGKAVEAGLWPNPEMGYLHEQIGVKGTPGEFIGGFVRQELVTGGKLQLSRKKYLHRMRVSQLQALAQQYRVLNDVAIHYYRTLGAARRVTIRRELLKNAEDNLLTTREMFNVGQANKAAIARANIILQQARLELMMAENDWRLLWERLMSVVGAELPPSGLQDNLEGEPQLVEWDQALQHIYGHSPQLAAAWAKQRSDMVTLQRERVEPIPNLVFTGSVGRNAEAKETVAGAEISLEVPLFDRNQGTIRQAEADLRRQRGEIRRIELLLKRRLAEQYRHYLTAAQHVQQYQVAILPEARKAYETQLESYKENRIAWPLVLEAEREYSGHRVQYTNQLVAWRESQVAIEGLLLVDGLSAPPGTAPPGHIDSVPKPR
jgi:outer membrane protein TolC